MVLCEKCVSAMMSAEWQLGWLSMQASTSKILSSGGVIGFRLPVRRTVFALTLFLSVFVGGF